MKWFFMTFFIFSSIQAQALEIDFYNVNVYAIEQSLLHAWNRESSSASSIKLTYVYFTDENKKQEIDQSSANSKRYRTLFYNLTTFGGLILPGKCEFSFDKNKKTVEISKCTVQDGRKRELSYKPEGRFSDFLTPQRLGAGAERARADRRSSSR